ncbi:hypothetical protein SAVIM338S_06284 [Streptomyces avidinii]
MSFRPTLRTTVTGACAAALLAGSALLALPAQAESRQSPMTASVHREERAEAEVSEFFQQYLDAAVNGNHKDGLSPSAVRQEFLTPALDQALDAWEGEHAVNPVFRRNESIKSWTTAYKGLLNGHLTVDLTERWKDGSPNTVVRYTLTNDLKIDGLTDAPAK